MTKFWISIPPFRLGKTRVWLLSSLVLICLLGFLFFFLRSEKETYPLKRESIIESVFGLATVQASEVYQLRIAVPSVLLRLFVDKGKQVSRGDSLAKFDSFGILKSPISGVVTECNYEEGELVSPQTRILTIMNLSQKFLSVYLEERAAVKVKVGQNVRIRFDALGDKRYLGKVESLFPSNGQFEAKVVLENFPDSLLPGMTADIAIEVSQRSAFLIPKLALVKGSIEIQRKSETKKVSVEIGSESEDRIEIHSESLLEGDLVVLPKS